MMRFEFDAAKDSINREKHGVPLAFGIRVFDDPTHVILASIRPIDGEDRYKAVGQIDGRLWTSVYAERVSVVRLISVRRSNHGEQGKYYRNSEGSR